MVVSYCLVGKSADALELVTRFFEAPGAVIKHVCAKFCVEMIAVFAQIPIFILGGVHAEHLVPVHRPMMIMAINATAGAFAMVSMLVSLLLICFAGLLFGAAVWMYSQSD